MTELPLRVIDQDGGAALRCLCGVEAATLRRGLVADAKMAHLAGANRGQVKLAPDMTTPGLLMMVCHAMACERGRAILAEQQRVWSGL